MQFKGKGKNKDQVFTDHKIPSKQARLEQIYRQYRQLMYYVAYSVLQNKQMAEDAVQESFLKIIAHLDKFADIAADKTKGLIVIIVKK